MKVGGDLDQPFPHRELEPRRHGRVGRQQSRHPGRSQKDGTMVRRRNQLGGRHAGGSSRRVDRIGQNVTPSQAPGNAVCRSADRLADVGRPGCVNLPRRLAVLPLQGGRIAARILRVRGSVFRIAKRPGTRRVSEWLAATLEMWCRATGCEFESRALRSLPEPSSQAARGLELAISALLRFPASAEPVCQRLGLLTASSHFLGAPSCRRLPSRYESKALGIAREVCKCLRDERFAPDWNGELSRKMGVSLNWQRQTMIE